MDNSCLSLLSLWMEKLQESGYRSTAPRRAIVEIIANSQKALDPITIFDLTRKQYPGLGLVTVYRTLEKLEDLGLVQRVHQSSGCHMYLRAPQGHQHLLVCDCCKQVVYFSGDDMTDLTNQVSHNTGFKVMDHWLQFSGLCKECQEKE